MLQLAVCIKCDAWVCCGPCFHFVFAEIETRHGKGNAGLPSPGLSIFIIMRFHLRPCGDQSQSLWPAKGKIERNKILFANVRVPRPAFTHELNAISRIRNDVAVIGDLQSEFFPCTRRRGKDDEYRIVSAADHLAAAHFFILKIDERLAIGSLDFFHREIAGELKWNDTFACTNTL